MLSCNVPVTDADYGINAMVQWSITHGNHGAAFAVESTTGKVTVNDVLDRETYDTFYLEVSCDFL